MAGRWGVGDAGQVVVLAVCYVFVLVSDLVVPENCVGVVDGSVLDDVRSALCDVPEPVRRLFVERGWSLHVSATPLRELFPRMGAAFGVIEGRGGSPSGFCDPVRREVWVSACSPRVVVHEFAHFADFCYGGDCVSFGFVSVLGCLDGYGAAFDACVSRSWRYEANLEVLKASPRVYLHFARLYGILGDGMRAEILLSCGILS